MNSLNIIVSYVCINLKLIGQLAFYSFLIAPSLVLFQRINNWTLQNQDYITIVAGTIIISHIFGTWVHWQIKKDFSITKNLTGLCMKISIVTAVALLFEGFSHIMIENSFIYMYIRITLRLLTLMYPLRSALLNCFIITNGAFPPKALLTKIDRFEETLDVTEFNNNNNNNNNNNFNN
jgi:hypothetical protein